MKGRHLGIFALALLPLLLTVPSAFAQVTEDNLGIPTAISNDAQSVFDLMDLITSGQNEAATLSAIIENNGLNQSLLDDYTDLLEEAAALAAAGYTDDALDALGDADALLNDVYNEIYDEVDSQQSARYDHFVDDAITSLTFLIENGADLGLTSAVIDELIETLAVLEGGDYNEIIAATSETSNTGKLFIIHPGLDNSANADTSQASEKLPAALENLPDKIKVKFGISTNNIGTQSTDGTGDGNEDDNGDSVFPGFGAAGINPAGIGQETGVGLGGTPPGFFNIEWSPDDWWGWSFDDFAPPFGEEFEPGAYGRANAAEKAAKGLDIARERSEGRGQSAPEIPEPPEPPGPPCGSPPCGGPP